MPAPFLTSRRGGDAVSVAGRPEGKCEKQANVAADSSSVVCGGAGHAGEMRGHPNPRSESRIGIATPDAGSERSRKRRAYCFVRLRVVFSGASWERAFDRRPLDREAGSP